MLPVADRQTVAKQLVSELIPGAIFASIDQTAALLGVAPATIRHQLSSGRFPLPTTSVGGRRLVPVPAIVDLLASAMMSGTTPQVPTPPATEKPVDTKRKRGRPRKLPIPQAALKGGV